VSAADHAWERLAARPPDSVEVGGRTLRRGSRVRVAPRRAADLGPDTMDRALAGKLARVESIEQDVGGELLLVVVLDDDPGRDLGRARFPGHRFFLALDEVEPLADATAGRRILVAGIGNVFLGDDGFGVEVARALALRPPADGVDVVDFGIRGMDLVYALLDGYDGVILVDALPLDDAEPGTLAVLRPEIPGDADAALDVHALHPARVLALAATLGPLPEHVLVVGCQPGILPEEDEWSEIDIELGAPVRAAVERAADLIAGLLDGFRSRGSFGAEDASGTSPEGGPAP
jgi:hydrogenase maturation protease